MARFKEFHEEAVEELHLATLLDDSIVRNPRHERNACVLTRLVRQKGMITDLQ